MHIYTFISYFVGTKSEMENLENKFVSGTWTPSFLNTSPEPPKKKKKQKNMENKEKQITEPKQKKKDKRYIKLQC